MFKLIISSKRVVNGQQMPFISDLIVEDRQQLNSCLKCHEGCFTVVYDMENRELMTIGRK